jgi:hypothetical protein
MLLLVLLLLLLSLPGILLATSRATNDRSHNSPIRHLNKHGLVHELRQHLKWHVQMQILEFLKKTEVFNCLHSAVSLDMTWGKSAVASALLTWVSQLSRAHLIVNITVCRVVYIQQSAVASALICLLYHVSVAWVG